jgi:hypothetical protein
MIQNEKAQELHGRRDSKIIVVIQHYWGWNVKGLPSNGVLIIPSTLIILHFIHQSISIMLHEIAECVIQFTVGGNTCHSGNEKYWKVLVGGAWPKVSSETCRIEKHPRAPEDARESG